MEAISRMLGSVLVLLLISVIRGQEGETTEAGVGVGVSVGVCEVCSCSEIGSVEEPAVVVLNVQCSELDRANHIPPLHRVEWPPNPNRLRLCVAFEGLGLTTLQSLPPNRLVDTLSFSNNAIKTTWPGAFAGLRSLRKLSLSQNELAEVTPDMFTDLSDLEELDLSYNNLTDFNRLDFAELTNLRKLNLQSNLLKKVPLETLETNAKLEDLDLSKNAIFNLQFRNSETNILKTVKRLNLSGNRIPNILVDMFPENSIELLDLSNNIIANIEESALAQCTRLRELNLASNQLTSQFTLPSSLMSLTLAHNRLQDWPALPVGITYLDLSSNELIGMYDEADTHFDNLEVLKISGNQLSSFELTTSLPKLFTLDIGYNFLQEIPSSINSKMLPALGELRLDGNRIKKVYFQEKISLRTLYLNDLREVITVEDNALSNVASRSEAVEGMENCIHLYLSNCPALVEISGAAFNGTPICMLDMSYNNLTLLPRSLVAWSALRDGLNLQGNPWDCSCDMQWLLDELLPRIHDQYPHYLHELRCETPRARQGLRMVHWLNWGEKVLCSDGYSRSSPNQSYMMERSGSGLGILTGASSLTVVLGACIALAVLLVVALGVYLARGRSRHYRIRRAMLRKRQSQRDSKQRPDQFTALNRP